MLAPLRLPLVVACSEGRPVGCCGCTLLAAVVGGGGWWCAAAAC